MKRRVTWIAVAAVAAWASSSVLADVKTQQRSSMKMEGFLGGMISRMAGLGGDTLSTLAVKGNRMSRTDEKAGQITDLDEQKIYMLDLKDKSYKVLTFAEM